MNALVDNINKVERLIRNNSSSILTALGVSGTISTAYLTGKASYQARDVIKEEEAKLKHKLTQKEAVKIVWKLYIPATISGGVTIACILGASTINAKRTAAITAAYSLGEKAFSEYKDKVVETLGEKEEQKIRDEVAATKVNSQPPPQSLIVSGGDVLCCEMWTGRYFLSNMEALRQAQNTINEKLIGQNEATLSDFYYILGIPQTSSSGYSGWTSTKMLKLSFSTQLADGKPCLTFEYNYVHTF